MKNKMKKIKKFVIDKWMIIVITLLFSIIYGYRMFFNYPWYDELYTYYSFICRGPIYSAIHWPLPNNHVGYSVISGFLSYLGNPTIALRGVSFCASVANIVLVYVLARKLLVRSKFNEILGIFASIAFGCVILVHTLAIQGRGYAFSTSCYIISILMVYDILTKEKAKLSRFIVFSFSLCLGIYVLPSSTFWVFPVCITAGIALLIAKKYKDLIKLVIFAALAALVDLVLYVVIWLAIGSNLLCKTEGSGFFGIYQVDIIKMAPFKAIQTGLDYMLASPYIQSMDRDIVVRELFKYLHNLFDQFYPRMGYVLIAYLCMAFVVATVRFFRDKSRFLELLVAIGIIMVPVMLVVQSTQPYLRVFSFFGVIVALSLIMFIDIIGFGKLPILIVSVAMFCLLFTGPYRISIADRENDIHDALIFMEEKGIGVSDISDIMYVDDYQKYVIKFYYNEEPSEAYSVDTAKCIIMPSEDLNGVWPMLYAEHDFDRAYIASIFDEVVVTDKYTIYIR